MELGYHMNNTTFDQNQLLANAWAQYNMMQSMTGAQTSFGNQLAPAFGMGWMPQQFGYSSSADGLFQTSSVEPTTAGEQWHTFGNGQANNGLSVGPSLEQGKKIDEVQASETRGVKRSLSEGSLTQTSPVPSDDSDIEALTDEASNQQSPNQHVALLVPVPGTPPILRKLKAVLNEESAGMDDASIADRLTWWAEIARQRSAARQQQSSVLQQLPPKSYETALPKPKFSREQAKEASQAVKSLQLALNTETKTKARGTRQTSLQLDVIFVDPVQSAAELSHRVANINGPAGPKVNV